MGRGTRRLGTSLVTRSTRRLFKFYEKQFDSPKRERVDRREENALIICAYALLLDSLR